MPRAVTAATVEAMGRTILLFLISAFVASGCYLSHTIDDDGGPCGFRRCFDASPPPDLGRDLGHRVDLGPPDLGRDAGPPRACTPGETQPTPCGHCGLATRTCQADSTWGPRGECTGEAERCGVDLMFLADVTGSHTSFFQASEGTLTTDLIVPLETDADVRIGVSAFADYPYSPYGDEGMDKPFIGVLPPTHDVGAVDRAIADIMFLSGGDGPEGMIEGLNDLSGGTPHPTAAPFVCGIGEIAGGCWRPTAAWRVIIVMTDTASHDLPNPRGGLVSPYDQFLNPDGTVAPRPPSWATVRANLVASGTYVYWIVPETDSTAEIPAAEQARELATQLGEDPGEAVATYSAGSPDAAFAVRVVRAAMAAHFGIRIGP